MTRYTIPNTEYGSMLSTTIAAALVYVRATSLPRVSAIRREVQRMRAVMRIEQMTLTEIPDAE